MERKTLPEREIEHWQRWQDRVDRLWGWQTPAGKRRADRRARLFLELGRMKPQSKVLEVGCGTGEFSHRIAAHVGELWATDLSPALLERAAQRVRTASPQSRVVFQQHDATQLRLPGESFDAVFGCSVLHHLDAARALREAWRVLVPGGWCVVSEPNLLNPQVALQLRFAWSRRWVGATEDETAFYRWQLARLIGDAGFVQVTVRYFDFLHPWTPRWLLRAVEQMGEWMEACPGLRCLSGSLLGWAQKSGPTA